MRDRKSTTAAVIAGAAVLATGAYALGSQQGGGGASAAPGQARFAGPMAGPYGGPPPGGPGMRFRGRFRHAGFGPDLSALAQKLGVSQAKLRAAFMSIRPDSGPVTLRASMVLQARSASRRRSCRPRS